MWSFADKNNIIGVAMTGRQEFVESGLHKEERKVLFSLYLRITDWNCALNKKIYILTLK